MKRQALRLVPPDQPPPSLEAEIHKRITEAELWGDPAWQDLTDWNNHIYARQAITKDQP